MNAANRPRRADVQALERVQLIRVPDAKLELKVGSVQRRV